MPRITISIPVDLKSHLADPRIRNALNISRVCQDALRREVRRLLDLPADIERMEALLARLREERERLDDKWFTLGSTAARDWVEHEASLARLRQLGDAPMDRRLALLRRDPPGRLAVLIQEHERLQDFDPDSFLQGWASMLGLMWGVIKRNL